MPPKVNTTNPQAAQADPEDKYRATAWGSTGGLEDLVVPSGQTCLIRRPGMQGMIKAGILNDLDSLTSLVQTEHLSDGKTENKVKPEAIKELMSDPKKAENMFHLLDRVMCFCVVKPEIEMAPNNTTRRKDGVIYSDMVEMEDKMFILNYAMGGTRDLSTFRQQADNVVGGVDAVEGVSQPS